MSVPPAVQEFRRDYRARELSPRYSGWGHFAFTSIGTLTAIAVAASWIEGLSPLELITVPATFLFANVVEYFGHRGPMHHPRRGLRLLYQRHTRQHHRFYTHAAMICESSRDFQMILFPPVMLGFFLGAVATPIGLLLYWLASANVGLLFAITALGYFLTYEWLHLCYHLEPSSWAGRLPFMSRLRRHHTRHHDPALMSSWNFNITFPICDRVMGTSHPGKRA
ncbi:sterol desaturase family protein [Haliangium sp.]|uniref:sterol desaturase family protein n=1 Tax=Haliangium sp. TaxID=2663208 RepID=UPI003D0FC916